MPSQKQAQKQVRIIGAGIAGLTTAIALARLGVPVCVQERAPALTEIGAGIQIGANAVKLFDDLGFDPAKAGGEPVEAVTLRDATTGRVLQTLPMGETAARRFGTTSWYFHRQDLIDGLYRHCLDLGVSFAFGAHWQAGDRTRDIMIAADGVHSRARQNAAYAGGYDVWRGLAMGVEMPVSSEIWCGRGYHIVVYPMRTRNAVNIVAVRDQIAGEPDEFLGSFDPPAPYIREIMAAVSHPFTDILRVSAADYTPRHADFAVGDAAMAMLPFLAQGAGQAVEDAHDLALSYVRDDMTGFVARRTTRKTWVARKSARMGRIYHARPPVSWGRNAAMFGMGRVPALGYLPFKRLYGWVPDYTFNSNITGT